MSWQGFASGLSFPVPFTLKTKHGKCMYCRALWVQLTLGPPTAETFTSHYEPPCFLGGIFVLFTEDIHNWAWCPLLAAFLSRNCVQCQQKLELLPPPNCMDDQDGPRDRMFQISFGLFLVLLNSLNTWQD